MKVCDFEGCGREVVAKGLCMGHYAQGRAGRELRPIRTRMPIIDGQKVCTICKVMKPLKDFYKRSKGSTRQGQCKACWLARARAKTAEKNNNAA